MRSRGFCPSRHGSLAKCLGRAWGIFVPVVWLRKSQDREDGKGMSSCLELIKLAGMFSVQRTSPMIRPVGLLCGN
jgi:hypothetical protein